jgi:hypothetical protein
MSGFRPLLTAGLQEIRRTWQAREIVVASAFFLSAGLASGWWSSNESGSLLAARLVLLAIAVGAPSGMQRALQAENRLFLQRQPLKFGVRITYLALMGAARSAQIIIPMGLGFAGYQRYVMGLNLFGMILDTALLATAVLTASWIGAVTMDLVDPKGIRWPWRSTGSRRVHEMIATHPLLAVQLAAAVRTPIWSAVTLALSGMVCAVVISDLKHVVEALMLIVLLPTLRVIDETSKDRALPLIATFSGAMAKWMRTRILIAVVPVIPASVLVLAQGLLDKSATVELTLYAVFGLVSLISASVAGAWFAVYSWRPGPSWSAQAGNWIKGVGIWGITTVLVSLFTLPPEVRDPSGVWIALGLSAVIFTAIGTIVQKVARFSEGRDWCGTSNEVDQC